jgi:hypothetical protein
MAAHQLLAQGAQRRELKRLFLALVIAAMARGLDPGALVLHRFIAR